MASPIPITPQSEPVEPSEIAQIRKKIDTGFKQFAELISAARRPLPTQTGDGTYLPDTPDTLQKINASLQDLGSLGIKDVKTLLEVAQKTKSGALWNDRDYLMERLIQTAAKFPDNSETGKKVTDKFLTTLYNDLQHPPQSYLGKDFFYRSADGSFNSLLHPDLGKADTPYARTVAPKQLQPGALPDAGDIFDSVMTRKHHEKHPNKISSMLFYLASIIIHDLFRTDHKNFYNSRTSSYLDLAPLYGSNLKEQMAMRTKKDGKIKPDCFSEHRLLQFPPGVGSILIMFNRFHNHVADMLARVNQSKQFKRPGGEWPDPEAHAYSQEWKNLDENLFQTARLITCGLYINIILIDYVRTILNLNKTDDNWALDPRADIPDVPVAAGNQVSAEFNLVYRWHSTISDRDEKWTQDLWNWQFPKLKAESATFHEFIAEAMKTDGVLEAMAPEKRPFPPMAPFQRNADGRFDDDILVKTLAESVDDCANSYGANRVPPVMRVIEILGIEQARAWNTASLNEFRKYFGLEPHKSFESINSDKLVADQLRHLYDHPDYVELYVGLVTEEPKAPLVPGAGLCPGYTISRAVLSDAVALVRGDRFYTIDYHPKKLTNWGFSEAASDIGIDNGCVFYKLFLNAFPYHFKPNSIYAHYPLTIKEEMQSVMSKLGRGQDYNYDFPKRTGATRVVNSYAAAQSILANPEAFRDHVSDSLTYLLGEHAKDFKSSSDISKNPHSRTMMEKALYLDGKWEPEIRQFYEKITAKLLKEKGYKLGKKNQVDIIRDVGNLAHIHFAADMWALPLKTKDKPLGVFTEHELYLILLGVFTAVYFDADPVNSFPILQKTKQPTHLLADLVFGNLQEINVGGVFSRLMDAIFPHATPLKDYGINLLKRLLKSGMDVKELVWGHILGTMGAMTANHAQLFAQTLEYYLTDGKEHLPAINKLAKDDSDLAFEKLMRYVLEGARLGGESGLYRYVNKACEIKDGDRTIKLNAGDRVLLNLFAASRDPAAFPNPDAVDLKRPIESYATLSVGSHHGIGDGISRVALTAMFKVVGKLDNLRPANGEQGKIHKVLAPYPEPGQKPTGPWFHNYLTESHDRLWPFPQTLKVNWE